nr:zinc finger, CCHC-type, retrotransposon Gag domain protein [Tanacetum cinerariifolium]
MLPRIRGEIRKEFRTGSGLSNAGGNPPPVTIHMWLEHFNKQKPHSFEKATAPVDAENWISHMEKIFDVMGADNHPPMLEKDMYDSWRSIMELYMLNRQHGRMILDFVEHGPLLWPSVTEDGVTRLKKYSELSSAEA